MCDYDGGYEELSRREVITRKAHECDACQKRWPAGSRMVCYTYMHEGDGPHRGYGCPVCVFAAAQTDHAPLHFCWGHFWDGGEQETGDGLVWEYIKRCLARGETPSAERATRLCEAAGRLMAHT